MLAIGKIAWVQTDAFKCITSIYYYFNFTTNIFLWALPDNLVVN